MFNVQLAAIVGALLTAADAFLNPLIILPLFAIKVDASFHTIALISAAGATSWFAALLCGSAIGRLIPQERVIVILAAIVRAGAIAWLAYGTSQSNRGNDNRLHLFFLCYVVASAAHGLSRPPGIASLSAALRGGRARWSSWFALAAGGVLATAAGLIVRRAMGPSGPGYPKNIALVFACAAAALAASAFFVTRIQEGPRTDQRAAPGKALPTGIANALAAPLMRRFLVYRLAMALLAGTDPFFIVYAIRGLKTPQAMAGVFLTVYAAAMLLSAPLWQALIERAGNRVALQMIAAIRIVAPLIALMLPNLVASKVYVDRVHNPRVEFYIFAAVFGALGIAARGQSIAGTTYVAEIAPERHHDAYTFLANISLLVAGFTPLIASRIVDADGFQRLFLSATIAGLIAVFASGLLGETRARVRMSPRALRPRHARPS
jgi:hypothetical protein